MGRLILLLFILVVIVVLWKAFGPGSRRTHHGSAQHNPERATWITHRNSDNLAAPEPGPIGPEDDPDFLWKLKKAEIDRQRKQEQQRRRGNSDRGNSNRDSTNHEDSDRDDSA